MKDQSQFKSTAQRALLVLYRFLTINFTRQLGEFWLKHSLKDRRTFSGMLQIKMAQNRSPDLVMFADKVSVRDYVGRTVGSQYLAHHYVSGDDVFALPWGELPREYVHKVNHGCGGNIIVWDGADPQSSIPLGFKSQGWGHYVVHPETVDQTVATEVLEYWLGLDYSWELGRRFPEWIYGQIKPQVIVEELLQNADGSLPNDYKFFCFNGHVGMVQVDTERMTSHKRALFSPEWKLMDVQYTYPLPEETPEPPHNLSEMIRVAEKLSSGIDFVRVDLYSVGQRVVFGELTNFPDGGGVKFKPRAFDIELGTKMRAANY